MSAENHKIVALVPVADAPWRRNQTKLFLHDTIKCLPALPGNVEARVIDCHRSHQVLSWTSCVLPGMKRAKHALLDRGVTLTGPGTQVRTRVLSTGFTAEPEGLKYAAERINADVYIIVWPGVMLYPNAYDLLVPPILGGKPYAYGQVQCVFPEHGCYYGRSLRDDPFDTIEPVAGYDKRLAQCPVPPLVATNRDFLLDVDKTFPWFYLWDKILRLKQQGKTGMFVEEVVGASRWMIPFFASPLTGDEAVKLTQRWGVLAPEPVQN